MHLWPWPARFDAEPAKFDQYLLNTRHLKGGSRAKFFIGVGFDAKSLRDALMAHAVIDSFVGIAASRFGLKFVFEGLIETPRSGRRPIRSVWHMASGGDGTAWLVTAIPIKRSRT